MQDYQDEVKEFFAVDKQLASELEYDMKKYSEQLAQEQELARQADVNRGAAGAHGAQTVQVDERPPSVHPPFQSALCCLLPSLSQKAHVSRGWSEVGLQDCCLWAAACSFVVCDTQVAPAQRLPFP